jgi:hypothetical protein
MVVERTTYLASQRSMEMYITAGASQTNNSTRRKVALATSTSCSKCARFGDPSEKLWKAKGRIFPAKSLL